jgi:protein SCO1/2
MRRIQEMMWAVGILAAATAPSFGGDTANRLAVISTAPDFTLVNQAGEKVTLADLRGKVCLVSFVFTTCNGTCPATTHRVSQVQEALKARGLESKVRLVSITLDPARDTEAVLRDYMKLYDADPGNWDFLTGTADTVKKVIKDWGMWSKPAANGQLDHPSRVFLLDQKGQVREIYHLGFFKANWVMDDIALLLQDNR